MRVKYMSCSFQCNEVQSALFYKEGHCCILTWGRGCVCDLPENMLVFIGCAANIRDTVGCPQVRD